MLDYRLISLIWTYVYLRSTQTYVKDLMHILESYVISHIIHNGKPDLRILFTNLLINAQNTTKTKKRAYFLNRFMQSNEIHTKAGYHANEHAR